MVERLPFIKLCIMRLSYLTIEVSLFENFSSFFLVKS